MHRRAITALRQAALATDAAAVPHACMHPFARRIAAKQGRVSSSAQGMADTAGGASELLAIDGRRPSHYPSHYGGDVHHRR